MCFPVLGGAPWQAVQLVMEAVHEGVCSVPPELVPERLFTAWHQVEAHVAAVVPLRGVYVPTLKLELVPFVNATFVVPLAWVVV